MSIIVKKHSLLLCVSPEGCAEFLHLVYSGVQALLVAGLINKSKKKYVIIETSTHYKSSSDFLISERSQETLQLTEKLDLN